jgi:hypothetical protein
VISRGADIRMQMGSGLARICRQRIRIMRIQCLSEFFFIYSAPLKRALWLLTYRRDLREAPLSNGHFDVPRFINGLGWGEGCAFIVRSVQFEYTRLKDTQSPGAILL